MARIAVRITAALEPRIRTLFQPKNMCEPSRKTMEEEENMTPSEPREYCSKHDSTRNWNITREHRLSSLQSRPLKKNTSQECYYAVAGLDYNGRWLHGCVGEDSLRSWSRFTASGRWETPLEVTGHDPGKWGACPREWNWVFSFSDRFTFLTALSS